MARVFNIKHSFVGGLLSPHILGRTDLAKYEHGCEILDNFIVKLQGDILRRPGWRYITDAMGPSRLVPFVFNIQQSYILEFGNQTLRFYINDGQIQSSGSPYQIATPYNTATDDLWDLKFAQVGDLLYITHPNHPPMKLIRFTDTSWNLIQPIFSPYPAIQTDQDVSRGTVNITVSGAGTTVTASSPVFIQGDVGKSIVAGTGNAYITTLSGATAIDGVTGATLYQVATCVVVDPFDTTTYTATNWKLRGSPNSFFAQGNTYNVGSTVYWRGDSTFGSKKSVTVRALSNHPTDSSWTQTIGTSSVIVPYNNGIFPFTGTTVDTFRAIDQGRYVAYSGGYGIVSVVTNSTTATIYTLSVPTISEMNAWGNPLVAPAAPGAWHFEDPAFSATLGYPRACAFFQDRLWLAGTSNNPITFWGSVTSDYENFAPGQLDVDGVNYTINSGDFEPILWMTPFQGNIIMGTFMAEYIINGGAGQNVTSAGAPITPKNVNAIRQSKFATAKIPAIQVDTDLVFVQRSKSKAYEFAFNLATSSFGARNLNMLNDLIIPTVGSPGNTPNVGFKEMIYQHEPFQIIWFVTLNGLLFGLTYDKANDVWAWHAHPSNPDIGDTTSNDSYISLATIPSSDNNNAFDEVWVCMKRIRNGQPVYTIELQDTALLMDACTRTVFSTPQSQITTPLVGGSSYLQGRYVYAVADGALCPAVVMPANGVYKLPPGFTAKDIQIGINFIPEALPVRPELGKTIQGVIKRWIKLNIRVYQTSGITVNGQFVPNRDPTMLSDTAVPLFTGDEELVNLGYDRDGRVDIVQLYPLPCNILSFFGSFEVGEI